MMYEIGGKLCFFFTRSKYEIGSNKIKIFFLVGRAIDLLNDIQ